jgi:PPOX class probable F420-dependent enzyme
VSAAAVLDPAQARFVAGARAATMATISPEGRPRLVPICFVLRHEPDERGRAILYSALDDKPKRSPDPLRLARVRDLLVLPEVTLLVHRWSEDWHDLAWVRLEGTGELLEPQPHEAGEHADAVARLREKYAQYAEHDLASRPVIRITVTRAVAWGAVGA